MRLALLPAFISLGLSLLPGCQCGTDTCATGGSGRLGVQRLGLPAGVTGKVTLPGPPGAAQQLASTQTLAGQAAGTWTVTAEKAVQADPRVRTAYAPTVSDATLCL